MAARVLIVDDDPATLYSLVRHLSHQGHHSHGVVSAEAIQGELDAFQPEVLVMDLKLPGLSGLEAIALVRSLRRYRHLPAVALTVLNDPPDIERALQAGFDYHLPKPVDEDALDSLVSALAAGYRFRRA